MFDFLFGDIVEFLKYAFNWVSQKVSATGLGFIGTGIEGWVRFFALNIATLLGRPRHYDPRFGLASNVMMYICIGLALYVFAAFIVRIFRLRRTPNHMTLRGAFVWILWIIAIVVLAWNTLGALLVLAVGWVINNILNFGAGLVNGSRPQVFSAIRGLLISGVVFYVLLRAAYAASVIF